MTPAGLAAALRASIEDAVAAGEFTAEVPAEVPITAAGSGIWSSPIALRLAATSPAGPVPPLALAQVLAVRLTAVPGIASADAAIPGFLNITLDDHPGELARTLVESGRRAGSGRPGAPASLDPAQVERVRFAHARLWSLSTQAAGHSVTRAAFDPGLLTHQSEAVLLAALAQADAALATAQATALATAQAQYPVQAGREARDQDPARLLRHLDQVATAFGSWYAATRLTPRGHDPVTDLHRTRLWLADATRTVLAGGLHELGLTAPERL